MAIDVSVGQGPAYAEVQLSDQFGEPTDVFDQAAGVSWESSAPNAVAFDDDDDANLLDRPIRFLAAADGVVLTITLDGAPGPAERQLVLQSEEINVHPAGAFSGEVVIAFRPVEIPPEEAEAP